MACATQKFEGVTSSWWDAIKEKAKEDLGITITSDQGEASQQGVTIKWNYSPPNQHLDLTCTHKPWIVTCGYVNNKIHDLVDDCKPTEA